MIQNTIQKNDRLTAEELEFKVKALRHDQLILKEREK
jgi:hypothetical protein